MENNLPLVYIIIPTYNRLGFFKMAFESAYHQTYSNIEIIVSDNSTNEDTARYMDNFKDSSKVIYLRNSHIKSKEDNFLATQEYVHGEYLNWLMDDDCIKFDKIEKMMKYFLSDKSIALVTSKRALINEENKILPDFRATVAYCKKDAIFNEGSVVGKELLTSMCNFIGEPSTVLFRKCGLGEENYFKAAYKGYRRISDIVMWLDLLKYGKFVYLADELSAFRIHRNQEQQQTKVIVEGAVEWYRLLYESYNEGFFINDLFEFKEILKKRQSFSMILQRNLSEYFSNTDDRELKAQFFSFVKVSESILDTDANLKFGLMK